MGESPASAPGGGSNALLVIVGLAGAGTMIVELSAVRLLAPWFGTSSGVWTNVIGVVLLALALGYLLGARLSALREPERLLGWALLLAATTCVWLPAAAGPVARFFLPEGVTLDRASGLLEWGSLATSLALFLPSALLLGCVGPLAVESVQVRTGMHAGTAGGRVLFASTLGSLVGTFGTTHLLLPHLGLRYTFALAGAVLALLGLAVFLWTRQVAILPLLLVSAPLAAGFASRGSRPPTPEGWRELARAESPYQSLRVVESTAEGPRFRMLQVNESFDSFQSVWQPRTGLLPGGYYYNTFALPAWWSQAQGEWRLLVLGLGAGTAWRVVEGALPPGARLRAEGVEIDPTLVRLAREHMELAPDGDLRRAWAGWDARAALRLLPEASYDQIVLDAYANQTEIPPHLASLAFFEEIRGRLDQGGWLVVNVGGFGFDDPVVEAIGCTVATAFEPYGALLLRVPFSRNVAVLARRNAAPPVPGEEGWQIEGDPEVARLLGPLSMPGAWSRMDEGCAPVLDDDASRIQALERAQLERAARGLGAGRAVMIAALLLALAAGALQGRSTDLALEGRYAEALADAEREPDALTRAQRRTWVLHHAGDLRGALEQALAGLGEVPGDPFLLDQVTYLAISLREGGLALEHAARLVSAARDAQLDEDTAAWYAARASELEREARALVEAEAARAAAVARARMTVAATLGAALLLAAMLAWSTGAQRLGRARA